MIRIILLILLAIIVYGVIWIIDKISKSKQEKHKQKIQELELELRLEKEKNKQKEDNLKN